jgi:3-phenylpropionate/cinnamic acid dioxygenase small subunit
MERTLQATTDLLEIERLPKRYAFGIDARDWAAVDACFTADARVNGTTGQAIYPEYVANLRRIVEQYASTMHFLGTQLADVEGDDGTVSTYAIAVHLGGGEAAAENVVGVRYDDKVRRGADGWRIVHREVAGIWRRQLAGEVDMLPIAPR